MKTARRTTSSPDSYFQLVRRFPLRPLRSESDLEAANRTLTKLITSKPESETNAGERDYIEALEVLIADAEKDLLAALVKDVAPLELLKHLMEERGMNVSDLGRIIGGQPAASLVLNGKRSLSKSQIQRLAFHFKLSPAAFMG